MFFRKKRKKEKDTQHDQDVTELAKSEKREEVYQEQKKSGLKNQKPSKKESKQNDPQSQKQTDEQSKGEEKGKAQQHTAASAANFELRQQIQEAMNENPDLQTRTIFKNQQDITLFFIKGAVNEQALNEDVIEELLKLPDEMLTNNMLKQAVPINRIQVSNDINDICMNLLDGWVFIHINGQDDGVLFNISQPQYRSVFQSLNEATVLGPKQEFTESIGTNAQVLRQIIKNEDLIMESMMVGRRAPKEVRIVYMKGIADEENVQTFRERISELDVDDIIDSSVLAHMIEGNEFSLFPQLIMTELPQRVSYSVMSGKVAVLMNGSPLALIGPVTFFSFFESTEDLYFNWNVSTFLRLLRFIAMFISVTFTPFYVATLTYHYEIIPSALLVSIGQSRSNVPFPPVMEALLLEGLIELLREAGARLPTKIGQTIGIVGGIVIGQAAVQAGFTSNILIIVVALSALASFTAPNYVMGTVIRVIRFPIIIVSGIAGGIGLIFGLSFVAIHLLKVTSLNRPYLAPIYPWHFKDFGQSIIRIPHRYNTSRSGYNEPQDEIKKKVPKKPKKKDIDE